MVGLGLCGFLFDAGCCAAPFGALVGLPDACFAASFFAIINGAWIGIVAGNIETGISGFKRNQTERRSQLLERILSDRILVGIGFKIIRKNRGLVYIQIVK